MKRTRIYVMAIGLVALVGFGIGVYWIAAPVGANAGCTDRC